MKTPVNHQQKPAQGASSKACGGEQASNLTGQAREAAFKKIWQAENRDFRGRLADGSLSLMSYAKFGGGLVSATTISDAELTERLDEVALRAVR